MFRYDTFLSKKAGSAPPPAGEIEFVGAGGFGFVSTTNFIFDMDSLLDADNNVPALLPDDLVVVAYSRMSSGTVAPSTMVSPGYSLEFGDVWEPGNGSSGALFYKFMGPVPDDSIEIIATAGGSVRRCGVVQIFRGVDRTTPFDVATVRGTNAGTGSEITPAAITPATPGAWPLVSVFGGTGSGGNNPYERPTSLSADANHFFQAGINGNALRGRTAMGFNPNWVSGEYQCEQIVQTGVNGQVRFSFTSALRPA